MSVKGGGILPNPVAGATPDLKGAQKSLCDRFEELLKEHSGRPTGEQAKALERVFQELAQPMLALLQLKDKYIEQLKSEKGLLAERIDSILAEHETLKDNFRILDGQTKELLEKFDAQNTKSQATCEAYDELKEKYEKLTAECEALKQTSAEIEKKYAELRGVNEKLMEKLETLEKECADLSAAFQNSQVENTNFKTDSEAILERYDQLKIECDKLSAEMLSWKEQYQKLNGEYARMKGIVDQALKDQVQVIYADAGRKEGVFLKLSDLDIFGFRKTYVLFRSLFSEGKLPDKYPD